MCPELNSKLDKLDTSQELRRRLFHLIHAGYMAGHGGPSNSPGFASRTARLVARWGRRSVTLRDDREDSDRHPGQPGDVSHGIQSSESDDDPDYIGEEDDDLNDEKEHEDMEVWMLGEEPIEEEQATTSIGSRATSGNDGPEKLVSLDHVLAHTTALRNSPSEGSARLGNVKLGGLVNTLTMLSGREFNVSRIGKFSRAECCHVASRYLPTDGPEVVEKLNSRAYIGQFSADGTLFVAGFQVPIYFSFRCTVVHCCMFPQEAHRNRIG